MSRTCATAGVSLACVTAAVRVPIDGSRDTGAGGGSSRLPGVRGVTVTSRRRNGLGRIAGSLVHTWFMVLAGKHRSVPLDHLEVVELLGFVFYAKADVCF